MIVPEQFTMQTQKTLVEMHPDGGILNIDVLSFERLAFRVFEEVGGDTRKILEETGKNMVLQKLVQKHQKDLVYLKNQMKKPGYLDEVKSLISEFMQYEVGEQELERMKEDASDKSSSSDEASGCDSSLSGISGLSERTLHDTGRSAGGSGKRDCFF